jgi:hypothetical protein
VNEKVPQQERQLKLGSGSSHELRFEALEGDKLTHGRCTERLLRRVERNMLVDKALKDVATERLSRSRRGFLGIYCARIEAAADSW